MDTRYLQITRRLQDYIGTSDQDNDAARALQQHIATGSSSIDYDQLANVFMSLFWARNFWKSAYFFNYEYSLTSQAASRLHNNQVLDVVIVGAGSGADTLAFMVWFNATFPFTRLSLTLIDSSQKQLDIAALFIAKTQDLISDTSINVRYLHLDTKHWYPAHNSADVVIMGHFLTENSASAHEVLLKTKHAIREGGDVIIIERQYDPVWRHAKHVFANMGLTVYDTATNENVLKLIQDDLGPLDGSGISSQFLRATLPDKAYKAEIVAKFFQAWRQQEIEPINEIFNPDASYEDKPDIRRPMIGLNSIRAYWERNPLTQSNIQVFVQNVAYTEHIAMCAFQGEFDTSIEHVVIKGSLSFEIDTYTMKAKRLAEYYGTIKTPLQGN